ncbi:MAG: hypothetical protein IPK93_10185 [Solirubrobacterales bacterium]|nr:hypothetical protein [Solirubrobacterales bacterium]
MRLALVVLPAASVARTVALTLEGFFRITRLTSLFAFRLSFSLSLTVLPVAAFRVAFFNVIVLVFLTLPFRFRILILPLAFRTQDSLRQVALSTIVRVLFASFSAEPDFGAVLSTGGPTISGAEVKLRVAGLASALLKGAGSATATEKVCGPRARPV